MGEVEGGCRLDGHTMEKGFQNEPQGNGGEQFPEITRPLKTCRREDQVDLTLEGGGEEQLSEKHKLTCLKDGCFWLSMQDP